MCVTSSIYFLLLFGGPNLQNMSLGSTTALPFGSVCASLAQFNNSHVQKPPIYTAGSVHFLQVGRFRVGSISHSNRVHFVPDQNHLTLMVSEHLFWFAAKCDCWVFVCLNESHQRGKKNAPGIRWNGAYVRAPSDMTWSRTNSWERLWHQTAILHVRYSRLHWVKSPAQELNRVRCRDLNSQPSDQ